MDYEDLSTAGQSTPPPESRPSSLPSPQSSSGPDQRKIVLLAMASGLVMVLVMLAVLGLPAWIIGIILVGDLVAMRILYTRLPPPR